MTNRKINESQAKAKSISVTSRKIFVSRHGNIFSARKRRQWR